MPTRALTRPLVLLLTQGFRRIAGSAPAPSATPDFGSPSPPFVPQKERVKRRLAALVAATAALAAALLLRFVV